MTKDSFTLPTTRGDVNDKSGAGQNGTTVEFGNSMYDDQKVNVDKSDMVFSGEADAAGMNKEDKDKEEDKKEETKSVSLAQLFRYATCGDILLMLLGTFCACLHGAALPGLIILFGDMTDLFIENAQTIAIDNATVQEMLECDWGDYDITVSWPPQAEMEKILTDCGKTHILDTLEQLSILGLLDKMKEYVLYYVYLGIAVLFLAYGQVAFWLIPSYRQTQHARTLLFGHIMRQEVGWFDVTEVSELNTRLSEDINKIQEGIGDKVSNFFQWFSTFLAGIIIGFVYGWKLCLVILATSPLLVISGGIMTVMSTSATQKELSAYAKAGAVAEEVFSSIRTVFAFGGEKKESKRYLEYLKEAKSFGIRKSISSGIGMGLVFFIIFAVYALAFWYGAKLVREDNYTAGRMLIVFFCVLIGAFALGNAAPSVTNIAAARGAAYLLWEILDRESAIDSYSTEGEIPTDVKGTVNFLDVKFNYPSRAEVPILTGLNLEVKRGQTVALVGASGCGKSTVVQLLQRFYDPASGSVQIDGKDIRTFNIKWLRQHIGVVSQEPVLFDTTIMENIKFGREDLTDEEVEKACREANAHDFIMNLPHKYDTLVGERGAQLSGGQKQRIAIARALVRDPKILLLDEATSALDTESEAVVQAALDHARVGRTTIVIAHRLSTIKNADLIYSIQSGQVHECGTHSELMGKGESGIYYKLVNNQKMMETETGELFEEKEVHKPASVVSARGSMRRKRGVSESDTPSTDKKEENLPDPSLLRILKMNSSEWLYIVIGCFAAIINGGVQPAYAIVFSEILGVFALPKDEQEEKALIYSMMFLVIAVCAGLAMFFQAYMFGISGECLTLKIRSKAFDSLLRQDIGYYDDHSNSTGALCTRLATDASAVQGATGVRLGTVCMSFAAIGTGIIIGFIYSWKLTLLILGFVPFLVIAGTLQMQILAGQASAGQEALENAGKIAVQALENIRTVASLTKEPYFLHEYRTLTEGPYRANMKKAHAVGFTFSFTQAVTFFAQAAAFYLGSYLVEHDGLNFVDMFKVFMAIIFGAMGVGQASSFAPDYGKAKISAARIFALFDREPALDSNPDGEKPDSLTGTIEFKDLHFCYPTRPTVNVLKGLNVTVKPKQVLAFVGSSGCGKSTSVALIERFYDPQQGSVKLDGHDLKHLNLEWLRSKMGIVQQEPVLFDRSIGENIAYGDNSRDVPMDEIIKAAREANIHSFIETLPDGYDTNVGEKGTQLSGGQKQRVAIARALLRDPRILLLDEATSALDTESEKVVQEALDKAQQGRTTVVIAHRLSTIQNADCITVIRNGSVAEAGSHAELIAKKGFYYKLNYAQQRKGAAK